MKERHYFMSQKHNEAVYDVRTLGVGKTLVLGLQHLFAMFGATVLVPALTGLNVSTTLLFAGLGTLLFHLLTKRKVPAFLGSSFAFLGGYAAIAPMLEDGSGNFLPNAEMLPYACWGVAAAGMVYLVISLLFKVFGAGKVMRFFPPIVTGPIIICIGLSLAGSALNNCHTNWLIALVAIAVVIACNIWGKGMIKIVPILLGVVASYVFAMIVDPAARANVAQKVSEAKWFGLPVIWGNTAFSVFGEGFDGGKLLTAVITIMPIALATIVEHIGDVCAISSTVGVNYVSEPGLHRTLLGDGLATSVASLFGAPANTTYGENTGVLALSKVYDPKVVRLAAVFAVLLSFCPKFAALIVAMPQATMGGVSLVLYGMISAVGVRNVVENKVDFTKSRNVLIAAMIMGLAVGIEYTSDIVFNLGSVTISLSGLAVAALVGIFMNAVLPGKDYTFGADAQGDTSVNFGSRQD